MTEIQMSEPRERKREFGGCARFKQNAWKKELCSNCYRPKDEHQLTPRRNTYSLLLPLIPAPPLRSPSQGILKRHGLPRPNRKIVSVTFQEVESQIIGYGGDGEGSSDDDDDSDQEDWGGEDSEDSGSGGTCPEEEAEEERALKLLTKSNTDFNSVLDNLSDSTKAPVPPLLLGHRQQKQKLTVTVQPFGSGGRSGEQAMDSLLLASVSAVRQEVTCKVTTSNVSTPPKIVEPTQEKEEGRTEREVETSREEEGDCSNSKEEGYVGTRVTPEGRKVQITRGSVITKSHEHKLYIQNVLQSKNETKRVVKETDSNKTVIITTGSGQVKDKEVGGVQATSPKEEFLKSVLTESSGEVTVKVLKLLNGEEGPAESREMAGEPDGKAADSDQEIHEAPPSPLLPPIITPPPRTSFLHRESSNNSTVILNEAKRSPPDVVCSESANRSIKRPAPKPPAASETVSAIQPPPSPGQPGTECLPDEEVKLEQRSRTPSLELGPIQAPPRREPPPLPATPVIPRVETPVSDTPDKETPTRNTANRSDTPVDRKKGSGRMKVTLKKLLRLGSGAVARDEDWSIRANSDSEHTPQPPVRPRPLIVHPLDLNKSAVQVLPPSTPVSDKSSESPTSPLTSPNILLSGRPSKPPPPPRSESLNLMERLRNSTNLDNIYANLGACDSTRMGMSPLKPQRTGSLREEKNQQQSVTPSSNLISNCIDSCSSSNNSSQEESNSENDTEMSANPSEQCGIEDDTSITYYGSETESDIYCSNSALHTEAKNKHIKTGRFANSNLRDGYSAIITANYKSLVHIFNKIVHSKEEVPGLFRFHTTLQWSDFIITEPTEKKVVNGVSIYAAEFKNHHITLLVSQQDFDIPENIGPVYAKFRDTLPSYLCSATVEPSNTLPVAVSVLKKTAIETLSEFAKKSDRNAGAMVLQQITQHIVKNINSNGKSYSVRDFVVLLRDNSSPVVCYIPAKDPGIIKSSEENISEVAKLLVGEDSQMARILVKNKVPDQETVQLINYLIWGPPSSSTGCEEMKIWLDIERANLLQEIVCSSDSSIVEQRLNFIISTDAQRLVVLAAKVNAILNK